MGAPLGFTDLNTLLGNDRNRVSQQDLSPEAVKARFLPPNVISTTSTTTSGAVSLSNASSLVVQSIISSTANPGVPLGGLPYSIVFFQGSLNTSNMIGISLTGSGYSLKGPLALPTFSPRAVNSSSSTTFGGSDGNNLVYVTELLNSTGSTQTIFYITNTRFLQGSAGGAG